MPCLTTVRSVNVNRTLALGHVHLEIKAHKRQEAGKRVNFGTIGTKFRGQTTSKSWGLCLQNDGKSMTYTFHKEEVVEMIALDMKTHLHCKIMQSVRDQAIRLKSMQLLPSTQFR